MHVFFLVDEEEGRVMVMNRKVEEANVLRMLQRRLAQVAEERQVPTEIPRVPDLNQPTLLLAKVYPNRLKKIRSHVNFLRLLNC